MVRISSVCLKKAEESELLINKISLKVIPTPHLDVKFSNFIINGNKNDFF